MGIPAHPKPPESAGLQSRVASPGKNAGTQPRDTGKNACATGGKPAGHQYQGKLLKIVEARNPIYRPAYEWVLANRVDPAVIGRSVGRAFEGTTWRVRE